MTPQQLNSLPLEKRFRLFTQWLGNQPEEGQFDYVNINSCALAQFGRSLDLQGYRSCWGTARGRGIQFTPEVGKSFEVLISENHRGYSPLIPGSFSYAYNQFAPVVGLPQRKKMNRLVVWFCSRFLKHKNALAA
jgi:hypothetical protein